MEITEQMKRHPLFYGLKEEEIKQILSCFQFTLRHLHKDEYIIMEGDAVTQVGWILEGAVLMEKEDYSGQGYAYVKLGKDELFAEPFLGFCVQVSTVNYKALTDCTLLFFRNRSLWVTCEKICPCHLKFVENLGSLLAAKTRRLLAKIEILSQSGLRSRILTYLQLMAEKNGGKWPVEIPFNKTELAEYLCVNRSALMRELGNLQREGILSCRKNSYNVLKHERSLMVQGIKNV